MAWTKNRSLSLKNNNLYQNSVTFVCLDATLLDTSENDYFSNDIAYKDKVFRFFTLVIRIYEDLLSYLWVTVTIWLEFANRHLLKKVIALINR